MNRFNFLQQIGYPLDMNDFDNVQKAYELFNALGAIGGNFSIISGCTIVGSTVSDGVVFINGELLEFRGGILGTNVIIIEEAQTKEFENGNINNIHFIRYAIFGTSDVFYPWVNFKPVFPTKDIPQALAQKEDKTTVAALVERITSLEAKTAVFQAGGGMVLWNKPANQIPAGWAEVVDWRGRMPVGFASTQSEFNEIGKVGGQKNKTLTLEEMPKHRHQFTTNGDNALDNNTSGYPHGRQNDDNREQTHNTSYAGGELSTPVGQGKEFSILNPYRVVLFIEWVGIPE